MDNTNMQVLVHQTNLPNAESIFNDGIIRPNLGSRGKAIYTCHEAPLTDMKARNTGTYLYFDANLGNHAFNINLDTDITHDSTTNTMFNGHEVAIRSSESISNIKYLKGAKPSNATFEMRPRMSLLYPTSARQAAQIIHSQMIPIENRPNIAGLGFYFWNDVPSASHYALGEYETILVADVAFKNTFENKNHLPDGNEYMQYDSFRGEYNDTFYFMVKSIDNVKNIRYIDGKRPLPLQN